MNFDELKKKLIWNMLLSFIHLFYILVDKKQNNSLHLICKKTWWCAIRFLFFIFSNDPNCYSRLRHINMLAWKYPTHHKNWMFSLVGWLLNAYAEKNASNFIVWWWNPIVGIYIEFLSKNKERFFIFFLNNTFYGTSVVTEMKNFGFLGNFLTW